MEDIVKKLPFIINPNLRLHLPNFKIGWHMIDFNILQKEASFRSAGRQTLYYNQKCEIIAQYNQGQRLHHWEQMKNLYASKVIQKESCFISS